MTNSRFAILIITKKDKAFNRFFAIRKQTLIGEIFFPIFSLINKSNKMKDSFYKISDELREFDNGRLQPKQWIREPSQDHTRQLVTDDSRGTKRKAVYKK